LKFENVSPSRANIFIKEVTFSICCTWIRLRNYRHRCSKNFRRFCFQNSSQSQKFWFSPWRRNIFSWRLYFKLLLWIRCFQPFLFLEIKDHCSFIESACLHFYSFLRGKQRRWWKIVIFSWILRFKMRSHSIWNLRYFPIILWPEIYWR
jgi:hypothetical protein